MLATWLTSELFSFLLVFARIGAVLMILPGIGDGYVPARVRLLLALMITALILPGLAADLPDAPSNPLVLCILIGGEIVIGFFLGLIARLLLTAVELAGTVISLQIGLSTAFVFNPAMASQGTLLGVFFTLLAFLLIFLTDLHHLMLMAAADSYGIFPPGVMPPFGDIADLLSRVAAQSFAIGVQMAGPFLIVGLIFSFGLGLLNRLMPAMQIYFIAMPVQIVLGLLMMGLMLSAGMLYWLGAFQDSLAGILAPS